MYSLSINNIPEWEDELNLLQRGINTWKKLPSSQRVKSNNALISTLVNHHSKGDLLPLFKSTQLYFDGNMSEIGRIITTINNILGKSVINDIDVETIINSIPDKIKEEIEEHSGHG